MRGSGGDATLLKTGNWLLVSVRSRKDLPIFFEQNYENKKQIVNKLKDGDLQILLSARNWRR